MRRCRIGAANTAGIYVLSPVISFAPPLCRRVYIGVEGVKSSSLNYCGIWIMELLVDGIWKSVDMDMCSLCDATGCLSLSAAPHSLLSPRRSLRVIYTEKLLLSVIHDTLYPLSPPIRPHFTGV
jgi:hypothetical protein